MFDKTIPLSTGITAHAIKASVNVIIGDKIDKNLLELDGTIVSFVSSFIPSAKGWKDQMGQLHLDLFLIA